MTDNNNDIFELKFDGNGINPEIVKPHEIADLLINFEEALLSTIKEQNPEIDTKTLLFAFNAIENNSLHLKFTPKIIKEIILNSYTLITTSFSSGDFSNLSNNTIANLKCITKFSKKYECTGYFQYNGEILSTFNSETEIKITKPQTIKGDVTIFGKVIDSGGEKPNVHLKINDEQVLIFSTSELNAQRLANRLYQKVALLGIAKWHPDTLKIEEFTLTDILDYIPGNTLSAINKLKNLSSGFWDKYNTNDDINNQLLRD